MKKLLLTLLLVPFFISAQQKKVARLVVGIVVDQMRNDYLYRYWDRFGEGGFKRLVKEGYYYRNTHYNYVPTYTGPGHASIYTGTTPRFHGIIGNDWYQRKDNKMVGCVKDVNTKTIGASNNSGQASAKNLLSSTIGDELKLNSNQKGKVFAIALKDRSAILPAGHVSDGAFWMDESSGDFVTSSAYMKQLPDWLQKFNAEKKAKQLLSEGWNTLYPITSYTNSLADENPYESHPYSDKAVFPYNFKSYLDKGNAGIIRGTAFGNTLTKELAIACLKNENLGKDGFTDLFSISFSSTDIVGHMYGPRSIEMEDTYLRLDKDLEELLNALDGEVGKDNYILFLTADHGGGEVPAQLKDLKIPAGYLRAKDMQVQVKNFFQANYGDSAYVLNMSNEQVFLNEQKIRGNKISIDYVENDLCRFLLTVNGVSEAYSSNLMRNESYLEREMRHLLQKGFNHQRSGNVCYTYLPGWMDYEDKGTTHGAGYTYDTHVPLIFYGAGIREGESMEYVTITQIAPSICELLRINQPNACTALPLLNLFKK